MDIGSNPIEVLIYTNKNINMKKRSKLRTLQLIMSIPIVVALIIVGATTILTTAEFVLLLTALVVGLVCIVIALIPTSAKEEDTRTVYRLIEVAKGFNMIEEITQSEYDAMPLSDRRFYLRMYGC